MNAADRAILLLHPPYGDATYPYHALAYVAGPLRAAGFDVEVLDINALWLRRMLRRSAIARLAEELKQEFAALQHAPAWDLDTQARACAIMQGLVLADRIDADSAVATLRGEGFYDYPRYAAAQHAVCDLERLLSITRGPCDFATAFAQPPYVRNACELLQQVRDSRRLIDDFAELLHHHCRRQRYLFCGVGMPFAAHVMPGLALMQAVRRVLPSTPRVIGGTAATDLAKNALSPASLRPLASCADILYTGEAETGVVALAEALRDPARPLPPQALRLEDPEPLIGRCTPRYVALSAAGRDVAHHQPHDWRTAPPVYDWIDWSLYLSPEKLVNYSPARGCFFNRCTFCDYGLNADRPTAPARHMDVDLVIEHLRTLLTAGIRHVYFAVDAIDPAFLRRLAEAILQHDLRLQWSTELFLTPQFDADLWRLLKRAGLVTASFGLESGSSAVLEAMGKGKRRVETVLLPVLAAARAAGITLQPKYFYGFPGETDADRQATVNLLHEHRDVFAVLTRANVFDLTAGSIVAREPHRFGITDLRRKEGDDIGGALDYRLADGQPPPPPAAYRAFNQQIQYPPCFERPWAGGIDTFHTRLYLQHHGGQVFHNLVARGLAAPQPRPWSSLALTSRFDLEEAMTNVQVAGWAASACRMAEARRVAGDAFDAALTDAAAPLLPQPHASTYKLRLRL